MRKYSVLFFIKQSLSGLFMNGVMTATSIFILMSCLILTGCFGLLIFNININLEKIDDLNRFVVFIDEEYDSEEEIERIKSRVAELDNVTNWQFIPKDVALERWLSIDDNLPIVEALFGDEGLAGDTKEKGILRDSIEIEYKDMEKVGTLEYQLRNIEGIAKIRNQAEIAQLIQNLKNVVMLVMIWFLLILFVIAIAIILNTIKLSVTARKNEIVIMRYIGATGFFILFPFLLEGIMIGIISSTIAYFIQSYIYGIATNGIMRMEAGLSVVAFSEVNILVFLIFLFTGVLTGFFGSCFSAYKYLKV